MMTPLQISLILKQTIKTEEMNLSQHQTTALYARFMNATTDEYVYNPLTRSRKNSNTS